jgi:hypothetical protein
MTNLAGIESFRSVQEELRNKMEADLERQGDPRIAGKGYLFDQYPYADDSSCDFYNRFMSGEKMNAGWVSPSDFEGKGSDRKLGD